MKMYAKKQRNMYYNIFRALTKQGKVYLTMKFIFFSSSPSVYYDTLYLMHHDESEVNVRYSS